MKKTSLLFFSCIFFLGAPLFAQDRGYFTKKNAAASASGTGTNACDASFQKQYAACQAAVAKAKDSCNSEGGSTIQNAIDTLQTGGSLVQNQAASVVGGCSAAAKGIATVNAAYAYFQQTCSDDRKTCLDSCNGIISWMKQNLGTTACYANTKDNNFLNNVAQVSSQTDICNGFAVKVQQASNAAASALDTLKQSVGCKDSLSTLAYCESNPSAIGCAGATDCSNATVAASNPICVCKTDPTNSMCGGTIMAATSANSTAGTVDTSVANATGSSDLGLNDANWSGDPTAKPDTTASEDPGGKKGGRALLEGSGGSGGGAGDGKGGPAGSGVNAQINGGFRSGSGGGGGYYGGSGDPTERAAAAALAEKKNDGPNLRQFLPGGAMDPKMRGLAGISGPDGITGPHSDIWQKIQNRYQVEQPKLMP